MNAPPDLTPAQQQALRDAQQAAKGFMGASRVAAMNGWTLAFFAAVSLAFGLFSATSLVIGLGLAAVARNELVGRGRLNAFDPQGLSLLWKNQIGLMALIVAYSAWSMVRTVTSTDPEMAELTQLLGEGTGDLVKELTLLLYGAVIVASVIYQGWNARYYFVRIARLEAYLHDTPPWIVQVQRSIRS